MKKLFLLLILFLFFSQCGYEKIYSKKNLNLTIKKLKKKTILSIMKLSKKLLGILSNKTSENTFDLEIESKKFTEIKSKDKKESFNLCIKT